MIVLAFIFKLEGLILGFSNIGFVALVDLILKYLKVEISISGIIALLGILAINLIFIIKVLRNSKSEKTVFWEIFKKYNV